MKQNRLARLNRIAQLLVLNRAGLTAQQIATRVDVNVRTIYRDLRLLEAELKVPIWQEGNLFGAEEAEFLRPLKLTLEEAVSLFLGTRLMTRFQDRANPNVISAYRKLSTILPEPVARHVDASIAELARKPADEHRARVVAILAAAWGKGRKVKIDYPHVNSDGSTVVHQRTIAPYFLEPSPSGHSTYVIGHDALAGAPRTFRVERIVGIEETDESFTIPDDFDIRSRFGRTWGIVDDDPMHVRLLFHDPIAAARARETHWHSSQQEHVRPDGRLELHFTAGGLFEITHWILTWGDTVEVLEPDVLRQRMATIAARVSARYASGEPIA